MKHSKGYWVLKYATLTCAVISLVTLVGRAVFTRWLVRMTEQQFNPSEAASIGIIGGADGPTAIFTTSSNPLLWNMFPYLLAGLSVVGLIALLILRRRGR